MLAAMGWTRLRSLLCWATICKCSFTPSPGRKRKKNKRSFTILLSAVAIATKCKCVGGMFESLCVCVCLCVCKAGALADTVCQFHSQFNSRVTKVTHTKPQTIYFGFFLMYRVNRHPNTHTVIQTHGVLGLHHY